MPIHLPWLENRRGCGPPGMVPCTHIEVNRGGEGAVRLALGTKRKGRIGKARTGEDSERFLSRDRTAWTAKATAASFIEDKRR